MLLNANFYNFSYFYVCHWQSIIFNFHIQQYFFIEYPGDLTYSKKIQLFTFWPIFGSSDHERSTNRLQQHHKYIYAVHRLAHQDAATAIHKDTSSRRVLTAEQGSAWKKAPEWGAAADSTRSTAIETCGESQAFWDFEGNNVKSRGAVSRRSFLTLLPDKS